MSLGHLFLRLFIFFVFFSGGGILQAAAREPSSLKTLVLSLAADPKTFNPLVAQETTSLAVTRFLFEGLVRFNPVTADQEPCLAESWDVSADGMRWTFRIRSGVTWSDGVPFTADDVLFTFNRLIYNPEVLSSARDVFTLEGQPIKVLKVDDRSVRFELPVPFAPFLFAMGQPIFPKHLLEDKVGEGKFQSAWGTDEDPERIIGTGPFKIKKYRQGERIELVRNPRYWRALGSETLPRLDRIILTIIPSPDGRLLKFLEGETDAYEVTGQDYPVLKPKETEKNFKLYRVGADVGSHFIAFNQAAADQEKKAWFSSLKFRQAVAHSLDRKAMIDIVFNGLGYPQCSPLSPSTPAFYSPEAACFDFDPVRARALLESEGFGDRDRNGILEDRGGKPVKFVVLTNAENPARIQIAQMMVRDLRQLGMDVHLLTLEFNSLVAKLLTTRDWDAVLLGLTGTPDPHFGANVWLSDGSLHFWEDGRNAASESQKQIDQIFRAASRTMDGGERRKLYGQWQTLVSRDLPHIYTVLPEVIYAVRNRFTGIEPTVFGGIFHRIEELGLRDS